MGAGKEDEAHSVGCQALVVGRSCRGSCPHQQVLDQDASHAAAPKTPVSSVLVQAQFCIRAVGELADH